MGAFTREHHDTAPVERLLGVGTLAVAGGVGFYFRSWVVFMLGFPATYIAASIGYALLRRLFGWPRRHWMDVFGKLFDWI
jgi:hypothetical protein